MENTIDTKNSHTRMAVRYTLIDLYAHLIKYRELGQFDQLLAFNLAI